MGTLLLFPIAVEGALVGALYADRVAAGARLDPETVAFVGRARDLARQAIAQARGRAQLASPAVPPSPSAKYEAVLRVLRGESLEEVSRDLAVPVADIESWRATFLSSAMNALNER